MLRLERSRHCGWRNAYAPEPVFAAELYLGDAFDWRVADLAPELSSIFRELLPGAIESAASGGVAELVAGFARSLQRLGVIGSPHSGVRSRDPSRRTADLYFSCRDPHLAGAVLAMAVKVVDRLLQIQVSAGLLADMIQGCTGIAKEMSLNEATKGMVRAVEERGIPWFRLLPQLNFVQLGQGARQHRMKASVTTRESGIAQDLARDKLSTLAVISEIRLPTGKFAAIKDTASALRAAETIGYPLVLKPARRAMGSGVYANLRDAAELRAALAQVRVDTEQFLLQSLFTGDDHRLVVLNGKLIEASKRIRPFVIGDGKHSIADLVEIEKRARKSGPFAPVALDAEADRILAQSGYGRQSVPEGGRRVTLKATGNLFTGATMADVLPIIHPDNVRLAVRAAKALGLAVAGIDFICPDISRSWHEVGGGICEVNTGIGVGVDLSEPVPETARMVLRTIYPEGDDGRIPTAMVTGSHGAAMAAAMLASILASAGHVVGAATSEGVTIGEEQMLTGDCADMNGAAIVLRDPTVTAAVLETSLGALRESGMYLDRCDVAALLDGADGGDPLGAATKAVVLNAGDPRCLAMAGGYAPLRTVLFARDADSDAIRDHLANGGDAVFLDRGGETIMMAKDSRATALMKMADIPAAQGSRDWPHAGSAMAAAALALALGIELDTIREGLRRYGKEFPAVRESSASGIGLPKTAQTR